VSSQNISGTSLKKGKLEQGLVSVKFAHTAHEGINGGTSVKKKE
jgi:hypothetical protein